MRDQWKIYQYDVTIAYWLLKKFTSKRSNKANLNDMSWLKIFRFSDKKCIGKGVWCIQKKICSGLIQFWKWRINWLIDSVELV